MLEQGNKVLVTTKPQTLKRKRNIIYIYETGLGKVSFKSKGALNAKLINTLKQAKAGLQKGYSKIWRYMEGRNMS